MGSGVLVNLAAPTSSASMLRPDAATVTLQFWNTYNPADKEASTMQNVVLGKFEQENPGIKVESIQIPYAQLLAKFIAAAAAGNPPAVLRSDIAWVPSLAADGVLLNLSKQAWAQPILKASLAWPALHQLLPGQLLRGP